ncbi:MAG: GTP cyclohydrolase I [Bacteroidaceae bacterium]|nr:GTP cyclohydrolase I [Bacteroidaceae bacterium]
MANNVTREQAEESIRTLLSYIGENPDRAGLKDTPDRILRMWEEIYRGYDPAKKPNIKTFDNGEDGINYSGMVIDRGTYYSVCEHHAMPFFGKYTFAYLPNPKGKILGISKIGRVVDYCAAKMQIQERLTHEIVDMLTEALGTEYPPLGMAIVMTGTHLCKSMRGARKEGTMTSSYLTGLFMEEEALRAEFMRMVNSD